MKITYDKSLDAMYVSLKKGGYSHTKKITDSIMVDLSSKDEVLGLEILDDSKNVGKVSEVKVKVDNLPRSSATLHKISK